MQDRGSASGDDRQTQDGSELSFGQKLRSERESQGLSVEDVAGITRIAVHHLKALEGDDFDVLPDDVFVKGYLRAYADCLDVDADLMVEDYTRERESRRLAEAGDDKDTVVEEMARILKVADQKRRGRLSLVLTAYALIVVLAVLGAWWIHSLNTTEPLRPQPTPSVAVPAAKIEVPQAQVAPAEVARQTIPAAPAERGPRQPEEQAEVAPIEAEPPSNAGPADTTPAPEALSVPEYGVGTAVENRQLVGSGERFAEGTKVWFWNRVRGGTSGQKIHHVWLREGVEEVRIPLKLGGSHWRTQSSKTLWPESAGKWAVEARDESGRVLARREFVCVH
jgi:cytoskeletal protein RodZ